MSSRATSSAVFWLDRVLAEASFRRRRTASRRPQHSLQFGQLLGIDVFLPDMVERQRLGPDGDDIIPVATFIH